MGGYNFVIDYHRLATAQPFQALYLLFAHIDLPLYILVEEQVHFNMTIGDRSTALADQRDIRPTETTLVGAHFSMLCIL